MSETKISIKLPSTPPSGPSGPSSQSNQPAQADPTDGQGTTMGLLFKIAFVVVLLVAGFFIFRAISAQSQLKQVRNDNTLLQSQLDQGKGELGKAQATAQEASDEAARLKAQFAQAQGEAANAKANADKASSQVITLQAQLEQARRDAAAATAKAEKAAAEVAKLQAQAQAQMRAQPQAQPKPAAADLAPVKPTAANAKPMPLSVSFQKPVVGEGKAVVLQNTSSDTLLVNVKFTDRNSTASQVYHLALDGGGAKELGALGAWRLASGDKIEIESADYAPIVAYSP
jgi:hypothetical protein